MRKSAPTFFIFCLFLLFSCVDGGFFAPGIDRTKPKEPDPGKQQRCESIEGEVCKGNKECEKFCDKVFQNRKQRQKCYEFSFSLVEEMEQTLKETEKGNVENIDREILECLLDLDDTEFARSVGKMSRRSAENFFSAVSQDEELARVLEDEDDEFNVLKQLLAKIGVGLDSLKRKIKSRVNDKQTVVWLFAMSSDIALKWLTNYIEEEFCREGSSTKCPGGEALGIYCEALLDLTDRDLRDFLSTATLFAQKYEDKINSENYEYEIWTETESVDGRRGYRGGFKEFCRDKISPSPV